MRFDGGAVTSGEPPASCLLPFIGTRLRCQNFKLAPTQYRQLRGLNRTRKRIFLKNFFFSLNKRGFKSSDASFLWDLASDGQDRRICKRQRQKFTSTSCTITLETYVTTYRCGGCYGRHRLLPRNGTSTIRDIEPLCCQLAPRFNHG